MTGHPDAVISHEPGRCCECGAGLLGTPVTGIERRQVTDLPEDIRAKVTEHREMKSLADASLAADGTLDHIDQAKLAAARHKYHSAVLIGERQTAPAPAR